MKQPWSWLTYLKQKNDSILGAKVYFALSWRIHLYDIKRYTLDENSFLEE